MVLSSNPGLSSNILFFVLISSTPSYLRPTDFNSITSSPSSPTFFYPRLINFSSIHHHFHSNQLFYLNPHTLSHQSSWLLVSSARSLRVCSPVLYLNRYFSKHLTSSRLRGGVCLFTEIFRTGDIPSLKLFESDTVLAFLDIQPLSKGHAVCSTSSFSLL
jgi:hypothetical protein